MRSAEAETMRVVIITLPVFFPGEAGEISRMLTSGDAWRVHLRKPGSSESDMRRLIEQIPAGLYDRLSLHDHFRLAQEYRLGGVHLNKRNPEVPHGWQGLVSRSFHDISEIAGMTGDYAFLSPLFPSISKPGYAGSFDFSALPQVVNRKIFALGGVTPGKFPLIERLGFGGAAMLGDAWRPRIDMDAFKLQFITHQTMRHDIIAGAKAALEGGCRWIQLRMKDASVDQVRETGKILSGICREYNATFIVDDHVALVTELEADGVHIGKNDMPVKEARRALPPNKIIGATANTFADIEAAREAGADYVGLGPFRFTSTKKNLSPVLGLDGYDRIFRQLSEKGISIPVVAIGGITDGDIPGIMRAGADGIALSGFILGADDPMAQTARTLFTIKQNSVIHTNIQS